MMCKRFFSTIFVVWMMVTTVMGEKVVYIHAKDGEVLTISFVNDIIVTFDSDNIVVDTSDKQLMFPLSDYVTFSFEKESMKINDYQVNNDIICKIDGNKIILENLPSRSPVCLYSLSGLLLSKNYSDEKGMLKIDMGYKKNQIIIIQTISKNFKIRL